MRDVIAHSQSHRTLTFHKSLGPALCESVMLASTTMVCLTRTCSSFSWTFWPHAVPSGKLPCMTTARQPGHAQGCLVGFLAARRAVRKTSRHDYGVPTGRGSGLPIDGVITEGALIRRPYLPVYALLVRTRLPEGLRPPAR
jgi:hypothetical protein